MVVKERLVVVVFVVIVVVALVLVIIVVGEKLVLVEVITLGYL